MTVAGGPDGASRCIWPRGFNRPQRHVAREMHKQTDASYEPQVGRPGISSYLFFFLFYTHTISKISVWLTPQGLSNCRNEISTKPLPNYSTVRTLAPADHDSAKPTANTELRFAPNLHTSLPSFRPNTGSYLYRRAASRTSKFSTNFYGFSMP